MNPNDVIDTIVDAIDYAEIANDPQGLIKARRLLNNDLRQVIDQYVEQEVARVKKSRGAVLSGIQDWLGGGHASPSSLPSR